MCVCLLASAASAAPRAHGQNRPVSATDFTGHRVHLAHPARRIVALTPHLVENAYTAGLGARLVGVLAGSNYPKAAQTIPRVGRYGALSLEAIVAKRPDLVLAWAPAGTADLVARLRALGIAVYVDDPSDFSGIAKTLRDLGTLGGTSQTADAAASAFMTRMHRLEQRYQHRTPVRTFYAVSDDPLITIDDQTLIGAAIRLCGGHNLYGSVKPLAPHIDIESLIARSPQVIVQSAPAGKKDDWVQWWRTHWPSLSAVAAGHFVTVPRDAISRPTVRMAQATAVLCRGLDRVRGEISRPKSASSGGSE